MRALFILATFVGSFALFLLEPTVAKALLPSFGGSSLVWNVSLVFFQGALLAGYAYANLFVARLPLGRTPRIHFALLAIVGFATWALLVPARLWHVRPDPEASPLGPLLFTLIATTAAPFTLLAAGTPLIQRWFAATDDKHAKDPYFLYAASNLGSFCGLLAYPILIEPRLGLQAQRNLILGLFLAYALFLAIAVFATPHRDEGTAAAEAPEKPDNWARFRWAALAAGPSALLLAVTSDLTKNIAPIPLLWVLPLGLYLLTFVIVFSRAFHRLHQRAIFQRGFQAVLALGLGGSIYLTLGMNLPITSSLLLGLLGFFVAALACHIELAHQRPDPRHLTDYYLWISVGGVLGGMFCALLAPLIFTGLSELPIAYGACVFAYAFLRRKLAFEPSDFLVGLAGFFVMIGIALVVLRPRHVGGIDLSPDLQKAAVITAVFLAATWWPRRLAVIFISCLGLFGFTDKFADEIRLFSARDYYGYETVLASKDGETHRLVNGTIMHGMQLMKAPLEPITYYAETGPFGEAVLPLTAKRPLARLAAVGLGTGTEAAYGRDGMQIDFYELNPAVEGIARNPNYFSYVSDSKAQINVILGDARLSLESAPDRAYDAIILDAFSSDSIPIHLLTKEAMELYLRKLKSDGIILAHVSNRYLDLKQAVAATGASIGLAIDEGGEFRPETDYHTSSFWVCLARNRTRLDEMETKGSLWHPYRIPSDAPVWTDDYSNVFTLLGKQSK